MSSSTSCKSFCVYDSVRWYFWHVLLSYSIWSPYETEIKKLFKFHTRIASASSVDDDFWGNSCLIVFKKGALKYIEKGMLLYHKQTTNKQTDSVIFHLFFLRFRLANTISDIAQSNMNKSTTRTRWRFVFQKQRKNISTIKFTLSTETRRIIVNSDLSRSSLFRHSPDTNTARN